MTRQILLAMVMVAATAVAQQTSLSAPLPGLDLAQIDRSQNPCSDFYQYACSKWLEQNPIPASSATWSNYSRMIERSRAIVNQVLEDAARLGKTRSAEEQKVGDFFDACKDENQIEEQGLASLAPLLRRIEAVGSRADLARAAAEVDRLGEGSLFSLYSTPNPLDTGVFVATLDEASRGVGSRNFYLQQIEEAQKRRDTYQEHISKVFQAIGRSAAEAKASAASVLRVETELARASLTPEEMSANESDAKLYPFHRVRRELRELDWRRYLKTRGVPKMSTIRVSNWKYLAALNTLLTSTPLADWRRYLTWVAVRATAPMLPAAVRNERFRFSSTVMRGIREQSPRWKTCTQLTDAALGFAVGKLYVAAAFPAEGKTRALEVMAHVQSAMKQTLDEADWLSPATRSAALRKLVKQPLKLGFPSRWRDYSLLRVERGDALGNWMRAQQFDDRRMLGRIGKKTDREEWFDPPQQFLGGNLEFNAIVFTAAILQTPFFDPEGDPAMNFGAFGAVAGHEITHSFDDGGRHRDEHDNLRDWWTAEDTRAFEQRAACFKDQYSQYSIAGKPVSGSLTLNENLADNGGLRLGYRALQEFRKQHALDAREGFTAEQRLFLAWGLIRCTQYTDAELADRLETDSHSPGKFRVNGVVSNMPEFQKAFGCKRGDAMVREKPCRLW